MKQTPSTARSRPTGMPRAFTLIEIIVAVAILVVIIGMLIVGLNRANKAANAAAGAMNVASLKTATESFIRNFNFPPPMIKDWAAPPNTREVYTTVAGQKRLSVYDPVKDRNFLRRDPAPKPLAGAWGNYTGELGDYYDLRYSNVSLPFYLAGACEEKGEPNWQVPIDGKPGPGLIEPRQDGTFVVPEDLKKPGAGNRNTGRKYESMVDTSKGGLQIVADGELREFRDSKGRLYRYYLWIQGDAQGRKLSLISLNIPRIVLETLSRPEDRFKPLTSNPADQRTPIPELNAATWAILWPGPDGAFGDEPIGDLAAMLGVPQGGAPEQLALRQKAIADNIAEVGQ